MYHDNFNFEKYSIEEFEALFSEAPEKDKEVFRARYTKVLEALDDKKTDLEQRKEHIFRKLCTAFAAHQRKKRENYLHFSSNDLTELENFIFSDLEEENDLGAEEEGEALEEEDLGLVLEYEPDGLDILSESDDLGLVLEYEVAPPPRPVPSPAPETPEPPPQVKPVPPPKKRKFFTGGLQKVKAMFGRRKNTPASDGAPQSQAMPKSKIDKETLIMQQVAATQQLIKGLSEQIKSSAKTSKKTGSKNLLAELLGWVLFAPGKLLGWGLKKILWKGLLISALWGGGSSTVQYYTGLGNEPKTEKEWKTLAVKRTAKTFVMIPGLMYDLGVVVVDLIKENMEVEESSPIIKSDEALKQEEKEKDGEESSVVPDAGGLDNVPVLTRHFGEIFDEDTYILSAANLEHMAEMDIGPAAHIS
jgi:hypothetical protein